MSLVDIFWIYFILTSLQPWISQRSLEWKRVKLLDKLERERHCRVIALVHRQETMSLLGFPVLRYINIEHSEEVLRAIKLTDRQLPINLIIGDLHFHRTIPTTKTKSDWGTVRISRSTGFSVFSVSPW